MHHQKDCQKRDLGLWSHGFLPFPGGPRPAAPARENSKRTARAGGNKKWVYRKYSPTFKLLLGSSPAPSPTRKTWPSGGGNFGAPHFSSRQNNQYTFF